MGNVIAVAKKIGVEIKPPQNKEEVEQIISKLEFSPSEGLKELWLNAAPGYFSRNYQVKIYKPGTLREFKKDEEGDGFIGFKKIKGLHGYAVLQLWSDTDSRISIYEMVEGEDKGKLICFPFSDIAIYHSGKTIEDLFTVFEQLEWKDPDDDIDNTFNKFFPPETRDNGPKEDSDDE